MDAWLELWNAGYIPTCPHWTGFQDLVTPLSYDQWLEFDLYGLPTHHAILRLPGESSGADEEVRIGRSIGMLVFDSLADLLRDLPPDTDPASLVYDPKIVAV